MEGSCPLTCYSALPLPARPPPHPSRQAALTSSLCASSKAAIRPSVPAIAVRRALGDGCRSG